MILGSVDIYGAIVAGCAAKTGVPFLAVEYRLAPEHPYPIPVDDCYAELVWLGKHAIELGVRPGWIALMGYNAGGGPSAATALRARTLQPMKLILLPPMLDDRTVQADAYLEGLVSWTAVNNITELSAFLGHRGRVPARMTNEDFRALPPVCIDVGVLDLFRDESILFASRALRAGIGVELHIYPGYTHGFDLFGPQAAISVQAVANRVRVIKKLM